MAYKFLDNAYCGEARTRARAHARTHACTHALVHQRPDYADTRIRNDTPAT